MYVSVEFSKDFADVHLAASAPQCINASRGPLLYGQPRDIFGRVRAECV
jgi:hypothetical protein